MFLPTTPNELRKLGWPCCDIILVTGDAYIDSPYIGVAVIGRVLQDAGYKVGIIAQPDMDNPEDISRLGQPKLFWGVSGGSVDSMVANYTASRKRRKSDDYTPGGLNTKRPDRAVIAYTNLIKKHFKSRKPIVIGGIEASLRRIAHYDFWSNKIRRSILFDSKADILVYGMAEKAIVKLADLYSKKTKETISDIPGLCYISKTLNKAYIKIPAYGEVVKSKKSFTEMFHLFYQNNDPLNANGLCQEHDGRFLIQNPPSSHLTTTELDRIYEFKYHHDLHPFHERLGKVKALETIRFSITSHRGCYGECNFCAIAVHQGRTVLSRSESSILKEADNLSLHPKFKGNIMDVGGPTANMYGFECPKKLKSGSCKDKRCLTPHICPNLPINHKKQLELLKRIRKHPDIKKIFIASGLRYDILLSDQNYGLRYLKNLIEHHVSGQLKIAPEHTDESVLSHMGKQGKAALLQFKKLFYQITKQARKNQFLTYYFIAAHPGCRDKNMVNLKSFCSKELQTIPRQTQIFTPTPSTYSTLMYYTQKDPFSGAPLFVEKNNHAKEKQKKIILQKNPIKSRMNSQNI